MPEVNQYKEPINGIEWQDCEQNNITFSVAGENAAPFTCEGYVLDTKAGLNNNATDFIKLKHIQRFLPQKKKISCAHALA